MGCPGPTELEAISLTTRTYVKFPVETLSLDPSEGEGFAACEYIDNEPIRQVTVVGHRWVTSLDESDPVNGGTLADQPLCPEWDLEDEETVEVDADYFERLWKEALRRRQVGS